MRLQLENHVPRRPKSSSSYRHSVG